MTGSLISCPRSRQWKWLKCGGFPEDLSEFVQGKVEQDSQYPKEIGGYTHASFAEVEQAGFEIGGFPSSDWSVVFKIVVAI